MVLDSIASALTIGQNTVVAGTGACIQGYSLHGRHNVESESTLSRLVETGSYHVALAGLGLTM